MKKFIILMLLVLASCSPFYTEGDFFYVENKGALMPVLVRGNTASDNYLVFLHGGPGGTSFEYEWMKAFQELESLYRIVYWDQRGSGNAQGNPPADTMNVDQFVEDTDMVIDTIRQKYGISKVFLMGHSWGGGLGTAYLLDTNCATKVKGWIEVDGTYNLVMGDCLSSQWLYQKHLIILLIHPFPKRTKNFGMKH